jgi:hypothetical protein
MILFDLNLQTFLRGNQFSLFSRFISFKWKNVSTFQLFELPGFFWLFELTEHRVLRNPRVYRVVCGLGEIFTDESMAVE